MLRGRRFWIGIAILGIFLFLFLRGTDFSEIGDSLVEADYVFLLPAILMYFFGVLLRAVRWKYLLNPFGRFHYLRLFRLIVIGFLVNNLLPGRLGIMSRAYLLGEKESISKMTAAGTIVVEQVFDGTTLVLFAAIVAIFATLAPVLSQAVVMAAILFAVLLGLCFLVVFSPVLSRRVLQVLLSLLPARWQARAEQWFLLLVDGFQILRNPRQLFIVAFLSILVWLAEAGTFYILSLSFNLQQPYHVLLLATSVSNLAWALITTPGGVGPFDYICRQTLVHFGVAASIAASYVIALHAVILLPMVALGFLFLWLENVSLAKVASVNKGMFATAEGAATERGEG